MDTSPKAVIAAAASGDEAVLKAVLAAKGDASCQDEITGLSSVVVTDLKQRGAAAKEMRPMIKLVNPKGRELKIPGTDIPAHYYLPPNALVSIGDSQDVKVGDVLARIPQEPRTT